MDILFRTETVSVTDGAAPDSRHMSNNRIYQASLRFDDRGGMILGGPTPYYGPERYALVLLKRQKQSVVVQGLAP